MIDDLSSADDFSEIKRNNENSGSGRDNRK